MGASDGGEGGSVVDCSVGTIVWVRRRNGSWWPGRILGPDELVASHLMSPRSGTPVKLLGREDASVDWYNLEKSKRVKAFRCGEFDACIERAESSQGIPIKKREKYARREDAILHALELENQQIDMKHQKLGTISNGTNHRNSCSQRRELHSFSPDIYSRDGARVHRKYANHKSHTFTRKAVSSGEDENNGNSMYIQKGKTIKQSGWEQYDSGSLPRRRGLQDFGIRISPPKKKVSPSVAWEVSQEQVDIHMDALSHIGNMVGDASNTVSCESSFAIKRKTSQGGNGENCLVKKHDRRRPLHQVLQSSAKLPATYSLQTEYDSCGAMMQEGNNMGATYRVKRSRCIYLPADSNDSLDDNGYHCEDMPDTGTHLGIGNCLEHPVPLAAEYLSSGVAEETESDSSETDYLESDPEEDGNLTDTTQVLASGPKECEQPAVQVSENFEDLSDDEVPLVSHRPPLHLQYQMMDAPPDAGVSKWHMKGKRNIRNVAKRPMDLSSNNVNKCNGHLKGTSHDSVGSSFKMRSTSSPGQRTPRQGFYHKKGSFHLASDGVTMMEKDSAHTQLMGQGTRRYSSASQGSKDRGRSYHSFNDSDDDSHLLPPPSWRADGPSSRMGRSAFWEESDERLDPDYADCLGDEMEYMLVDVEIQVQKQSYRGEHVPWVSLSSKGNGGKPVLGHPVQIEILEDGSTDHLISKYDAGLEGSSMPPASRRTAKRIPRSNPAASALDDDDDPLYSDEENKPPPKRAYTGYFNHQARLAKSNSHARRPTMAGTFQKTPLNKASLSSQKTRTLSSLATKKRLGAESGPRRNVILDGLIKPEGEIPLVTCVPVKVVFSRILEAVGRPSSISVHRTRLASSAVRGLS